MKDVNWLTYKALSGSDFGGLLDSESNKETTLKFDGIDYETAPLLFQEM